MHSDQGSSEVETYLNHTQLMVPRQFPERKDVPESELLVLSGVGAP